MKAKILLNDCVIQIFHYVIHSYCFYYYFYNFQLLVILYFFVNTEDPHPDR